MEAEREQMTNKPVDAQKALKKIANALEYGLISRKVASDKIDEVIAALQTAAASEVGEAPEPVVNPSPEWLENYANWWNKRYV
jgi:hypothetical protein